MLHRPTVQELHVARSWRDLRTSQHELALPILTVTKGTAEAYGCEVEATYTRQFVPLFNDATLTEHALTAARTLFGAKNVSIIGSPRRDSEDFARFLKYALGCFVVLATAIRHPCTIQLTTSMTMA